MSSNILTLSILKIIIIECVRFQMIKVFLRLCRKKMQVMHSLWKVVIRETNNKNLKKSLALAVWAKHKKLQLTIS